MSFKENLLTKIEIKKLAAQIIRSFSPRDDIMKIDKTAMQSLLKLSNYKVVKERDLELYIPSGLNSENKVLALDNGLAFYNTTIQDVVLRKSPTVREMVSIRNVIKILNDSKVVISKKAETVKIISREAIERLDLNFTESDIEQIRLEGTSSLENRYQDGALEALELFAELLGYVPCPGSLSIQGCKITGALEQTENNISTFGPIVIFSMINNELKLMNTKIKTRDRAGKELIGNIVTGQTSAHAENGEVFSFLKSQIPAQN